MTSPLRAQVLGLLFVCTLPGVAGATPPAAPSLADVVAAALAHAPALAVPAAIAAEGEARRTQTASLFAADPALVVRHQTDRVGAQDGFREWEAGLEAPLWLPGQKGQRRREAYRYLVEADAATAALRWEVAGEVRERLWQLLIAHAELAQAETTLAGAEELQRLVQRRVTAGELARAELILSRKDTLTRAADLQLRRSELALAQESYRQYTGSDTLPADFAEQLKGADQLAEDHPALRSARAAVERTRAVRDRTRGEGRANPTLLVSGVQSRDLAAAGYEGSINLELRIPLGLPSQSAATLATAERGLTEGNAELGRVHRVLLDTLYREAAAYRGLLEQVQLAEQQLALADEGERLARRGFELGESDLFKLLAAREQALAAHRKLKVGRLEVGRAIARYNQAAGVLPE